MAENDTTRKKKKRMSNHQMGKPCNCIHLKFFEEVSLQERQKLLRKFNWITSKDQQDAILASFILLIKVKQRRSRMNQKEPDFHCYSYQYNL